MPAKPPVMSGLSETSPPISTWLAARVMLAVLVRVRAAGREAVRVRLPRARAGISRLLSRGIFMVVVWMMGWKGVGRRSTGVESVGDGAEIPGG